MIIEIKTVIVCLLTIVSCSFLPHSAHAQEEGFANTSDDILELLTEPANGSVTYKTRSVSNTRGVQVVKSGNGGGAELLKEVRAEVSKKNGYGKQNEHVRSVRLRIEFDSGSARLRQESMQLIGELAAALKDNRAKEMRVCIVGHTDSEGPFEYNLKLSYERAMMVKQTLITMHGILPDRMEVLGYGESRPLHPNSSSKNKQANRRVEVLNLTSQ